MDEEQREHLVLPSLSAKYPWFVALDVEDETEVQMFYTLVDPMCRYRCRIPELVGKHIRGCFHGWVLLSSHPDNIKWSLWNPITSKSIRLPPLIDHTEDIRYCCLSAPPDDHPNSVVLLTRYKRTNIVFCRLDRKRKKLRWTEMSYAKKVRTITGMDGYLHRLTYCRGKVYAIVSFDADTPSRLIHLDILVKDTELVINLLPIIKLPSPSCFSLCHAMFGSLKGSGTELFSIGVGFKDETRKIIGGVTVFKLDMLTMMWKEMEDLEDAVFSVEVIGTSLTVSYSPATASELAGYIHIRCDNGKVIYLYNFKDKTISLSSMPCTLVPTTHLSPWEMLECSRLEGDDSHLKQEGKDDDNSMTNAVDELNTRPRFLEKGRGFYVGSVVSCFGYESSLEDDDDDVDFFQQVHKESEIAVNSDEVGFYNMTSESHLLNIPFHVLETIMEFCVGVEFLNFRATCKRCHLAAPLIQWSSKKASERFLNHSLASPWLMVFDQGIITFKDPIFGDTYFIKTPQELISEFEIKCSRYGWLLMIIELGSPKLVFYNPFTNDIRTIPQLLYLDSYCFSAPPTSPDCMVVGLYTPDQLETWHISLHFFGRDDPSWLRLNLRNSDQGSFRFPTFYGRDLYALCKDGVHVFRDIDSEDYSWEAVADKAPASDSAQHFLVTCDQHLLLVVVSAFGESVEVFKPTDDDYDDDDDLEWEKIDGLGRHTIFICDTTCLCVEMKTPEMENKIYFPRMHSCNDKIVFYSLETCRYHTFNGNNIQENFDDFLGTKHHLSSHVWIQPSWC